MWRSRRWKTIQIMCYQSHIHSHSFLSHISQCPHFQARNYKQASCYAETQTHNEDEEYKQKRQDVLLKNLIPGKRNASPYLVSAYEILKIICKQKTWNPDVVTQLDTLDMGMKPYIVSEVIRMVKDPDLAFSFFKWAESKQGYYHDFYTYEIMVEILVKNRRMYHLNMVVKDMEDRGIYPDRIMFVNLIRVYSLDGDFDQVIRIFRKMVASGCCVSAKNYNYFLGDLAQHVQVAYVKEVFTMMVRRDMPLFDHTYSKCVLCLLNGQEFEFAGKLFGFMSGKGYALDAYARNMFVKCLSEKGRFEIVMKVFDGCSVEVRDYNYLISGLIRCLRIGSTEEVFARMLRLDVPLIDVVYARIVIRLLDAKEFEFVVKLFGFMSSKGVRLNVHACNELVKGLCKNGRFGSGMKVFEWMEKNGCPRTGATYKDVIRAFCNAGRSRDAFQVWNAMASEGIVPDWRICGALIHGLCKMDKADTAYNIFMKMIGKGIVFKTAVYNALIAAFCRAGELAKAEILASFMEKNGSLQDIFTYNTLIDHYSKFGRMDKAENLLEKMTYQNISPDGFTYNSLLEGYCKANRLEKAYSLLTGKMDASGLVSVISYNIILDALCNLGRSSTAYKVLKEMSQKGISPNVVSYTTLIKGLFGERQRDLAEELCLEMTSKGIVPDAYFYLTYFRKSDKIEESCDMIYEMMGKGIAPDKVTYRVVIQDLCKALKLDKAVEFFEEMQKNGCYPDENLYDVLIEALCMDGQVDRACALWDDMMLKGFALSSATREILVDAIQRKEKRERNSKNRKCAPTF